MKARQKNKQSKRWKALFKEYNEWLSQYRPLTWEFTNSWREILELTKENKEKERYTGYNVLSYPLKPLQNGE